MRSAPFCVNHKNRIIIAYLFQFINLDKLIYKKLTLKFNEVYLSKTMTESKTELKMYSSFCCFEQEAIESALKEAGINYRIEPLNMGSDERPLDCFNLFTEPEPNLDLQSIEMEIVLKYREQFNLKSCSSLWEIQKLVQYGQ
jgi:hypothetical protein